MNESTQWILMIPLVLSVIIGLLSFLIWVNSWEGTYFGILMITFFIGYGSFAFIMGEE